MPTSFAPLMNSIGTSTAAALPQLACVVVDDNEMNRLMLEHYVSITDGLVLAGSFADGVTCLNYFRNGGTADILLLDISMPELTGLDLVRILPEPTPAVVLVTSHRDYAVDAFELRVSDYLVKPLDYARFIRTVDRIRSERTAHAPKSWARPCSEPMAMPCF
ncbi:LytR/AlgR family response regulator transcription factor [Hymenobacter sp. BRD67]|uniref:LytR/AlgR family response regulator transcription factor n=1 Tax=Hymenobacter sp. BRD67 TaxID=2675877 RepID=UPI0015674A8A|nr:response regulator [Hymenobacter sp. BRD67]QKG53573.1 response regulator [Hymenobacter sp. BRD67]